MRHTTSTAPDTRIASVKPAFGSYLCGSVDERHLTSRPGQHRWQPTQAPGFSPRNSRR